MKKINWISGLKGICALIVLMRHFVNGFIPVLHTGNVECVDNVWGG